MASFAVGYEIPGVLWRRDPGGAALPLVFDSPHSGSLYPEDFAYSCSLTALWWTIVAAERRSAGMRAMKLACADGD